jgi:hypothetical protein
MTTNCRNCKKTFNVKNTVFCSTSCYRFYSDALEREVFQSLEDNDNKIEKMSNSTILKCDQNNCNHEYSKNGTMSCRKCGHSSFLIK